MTVLSLVTIPIANIMIVVDLINTKEATPMKIKTVAS